MCYPLTLPFVSSYMNCTALSLQSSCLTWSCVATWNKSAHTNNVSISVCTCVCVCVCVCVWCACARDHLKQKRTYQRCLSKCVCVHLCVRVMCVRTWLHERIVHISKNVSVRVCVCVCACVCDVRAHVATWENCAHSKKCLGTCVCVCVRAWLHERIAHIPIMSQYVCACVCVATWKKCTHSKQCLSTCACVCVYVCVPVWLCCFKHSIRHVSLVTRVQNSCSRRFSTLA